MYANSSARFPQPVKSLSPRTRRRLARIGLVLLIALPCIAPATPPDRAPAGSWSGKAALQYPGHSGRQWGRDYGVRSGRCDRREIGAAGDDAGPMAPGAARATARAAATVPGSVVGAAIGNDTGSRMDMIDRACVGHALELSRPGQTVSWTNPNTLVAYKVTPLEEAQRADRCRKFRLIATGGFGLAEGRAVACPDADGLWSLAGDVRLGSR